MPRLLLVDDDEEILDLLSGFFVKYNYAVSLASDGAEMFAALARETIDLVVLDVMLPVEDGLSLCRQLRVSSSLPVIMLTAMGDHTDRVVGLEIGADDYLAKPFDARELLARVRAVLRRSSGTNGGEAGSEIRPAVTFSGWRPDLFKRELRNSMNMLVPLSGAEFDLLLAFTEHPHRVLTRDQLLDYASGRGSEAMDRSIDVQVSLACPL